jgi:hypothetical protein
MEVAIAVLIFRGFEVTALAAESGGTAEQNELITQAVLSSFSGTLSLASLFSAPLVIPDQ